LSSISAASFYAINVDETTWEDDQNSLKPTNFFHKSNKSAMDKNICNAKEVFIQLCPSTPWSFKIWHAISCGHIVQHAYEHTISTILVVFISHHLGSSAFSEVEAQCCSHNNTSIGGKEPLQNLLEPLLGKHLPQKSLRSFQIVSCLHETLLYLICFDMCSIKIRPWLNNMKADRRRPKYFMT